MRIKILLSFLALTFLSGCAFNAETVGRAFGVHQSFPTLSMAVQECVAPYPDVRAQIIDPFNVLVDKWELARDKGTEELLLEAVSARRHMNEMGAAWSQIKTTLSVNDIDCGEGVRALADNAEVVFKAVDKELTANARVVTWLEIGNIAASLVTGRGGKVVRMQ